ncbi:hypothetical protein BC936DRAFT_147473 [Jimgerdemannia flammicorona]|uniref:Uncharacterized protein n=1 Tax=Jimgerdemannia flammicorona TaxID=994334 RepID=A0A433D590_9FUNG|nr:hypothetical protein BC936DRAFT_147473 [Jimgerdemannia flammicorona]
MLRKRHLKSFLQRHECQRQMVTKTNIKVKKQKMYIVCHDTPHNYGSNRTDSPASVSISLTSQTVEDNIEEGGDDQHYHKAPSMKPMIEITSVTPSGDKAEEIQDSEQITVDLTEIATQLQREPLAEVCSLLLSILHTSIIYIALLALVSG